MYYTKYLHCAYVYVLYKLNLPTPHIDIYQQNNIANEFGMLLLYLCSSEGYMVYNLI